MQKKKKLEQGDIFSNWIPIEKIKLIEKCDKRYRNKDKDNSLRIANLYGISKYENMKGNKEKI